MTNNEFHLMLLVSRLLGILEGQGKVFADAGIFDVLVDAFNDDLLIGQGEK